MNMENINTDIKLEIHVEDCESMTNSGNFDVKIETEDCEELNIESTSWENKSPIIKTECHYRPLGDTLNKHEDIKSNS